MAERYAVYFAPERDSALDAFGRRWVGRCAESGKEYDQPELTVLTRDELHKLTESPRHYGFHGTLAPPFCLRDDVSPDQLMERACNLAEEFSPFVLEPLSVREIGTFLALVPAGQVEVARLSEACVRFFHSFRIPPTLAQMERRRARGLTAVQERLLATWGYPFVMEEYLFHLTLTDSIRDKGRRRKVSKCLAKYTEPLCKMTHWVRDLCIFHQADEAASFNIIHRIPLGK